MLCFLCSFSQGKFCYCRPGRPTLVVSTSDMLIIDTTIPPRISPLRARRSHSEPARKDDYTEFVRFRSLRETKKEERKATTRPFRVSVVSIASSGDRKWSNRRQLRQRAKKRVQAQLSTSSSSDSDSSPPIPPIQLSMATEKNEEASLPHNLSEASIGPGSVDFQEINNSNSPSQYAVVLNGRGRGLELETDEDEESIDRLKEIIDTPIDIDLNPLDRNLPSEEQIDLEIEKMKLSLKQTEHNTVSQENQGVVDELDDNLPINWANPVSYAKDLERYINASPSNPFADPFEDEERRSRTELWVESTSPGIPESEDELDSIENDRNDEVEIVDEVTLIPQVTIEECSAEEEEEDSLASTSLQLEKTEETPSFVEIQINGELLQDPKRKTVERMDSLQTEQTEDPSSEASFVSSELDKKSLVKLKFRKNLEKAITFDEEDVNIENVEKFWNYRYSPNTKSSDGENTNTERKSRVPRSKTPTVERVIRFYTSGKRSSIASSVSPSHSMMFTPDISARSPGSLHLSADAAYFQFKQPVPPPSDNVDTQPEASAEKSEPEDANSDSHNESCEDDDISIKKSSDETEVPSEPSESLVLSSEDELVVKRSGTPFFRLASDSQSEDEQGRVASIVGDPILLDSPEPPLDVKKRSRSVGTSTEDLPTALYAESRRNPLIEANFGASAVEANPLVSRQVDLGGLEGRRASGGYKERQMGENHSKMQSPNPTIVEDKIDDASEECELRLADGRLLEDIETSSVEDLLAIDTRPNSRNNKSVHFSENLDVEIVSPQTKKKSKKVKVEPITTKPILKHDIKQETMRKLMEFAGERLYKDLRLLVEERDRAVHALEISAGPIPSPDMSPYANHFNMRYRDKMADNKSTLDARIDEIWRKLIELPLDAAKAKFVCSVRDSSQLTLNLRRSFLPRRHSGIFQFTRKSAKSDLEVASDYAIRLEKMRATMIRRDSENMKNNERSVEDILRHVSSALQAYERS